MTSRGHSINDVAFDVGSFRTGAEINACNACIAQVR